MTGKWRGLKKGLILYKIHSHLRFSGSFSLIWPAKDDWNGARADSFCSSHNKVFHLVNASTVMGSEYESHHKSRFQMQDMLKRHKQECCGLLVAIEIGRGSIWNRWVRKWLEGNSSLLSELSLEREIPMHCYPPFPMEDGLFLCHFTRFIFSWCSELWQVNWSWPGGNAVWWSYTSAKAPNILGPICSLSSPIMHVFMNLFSMMVVNVTWWIAAVHECIF